MSSLYNYIIHLLAGLAMVGVFGVIYVKTTPYNEIALIRQGCVAAAVSLAGAVIGFSLTIASSIVHSDTFMMFLLWGSLAGIVQIGAYAILSRALPGIEKSLVGNNVAIGSLMGLVSIVVGIINAACLS